MSKNSWARAIGFLKQFLQSKQILQGSSDISSYTHAPRVSLLGMCGDGKFVVCSFVCCQHGDPGRVWGENVVVARRAYHMG